MVHNRDLVEGECRTHSVLWPTTGRPRRCGWLDLVALRYAIRVNGLTSICLTKLDVLDGLNAIKVCTHYETPSGKLTEFPLNLDEFTNAKPVYVERPGWDEDISNLTSFDELPQNARDYVSFISKEVGVQIKMVSVGTQRRQTIHLLTI